MESNQAIFLFLSIKNIMDIIQIIEAIGFSFFINVNQNIMIRIIEEDVQNM